MQLAKPAPLAFAVLAMLLFLFAPFQALAQSRTSVKGHDPEHGRDLVLRMERFRTCDECPHYEIKIFADGASMFHGKDAVRSLGMWGDYLLRWSSDSALYQWRAKRFEALLGETRLIGAKMTKSTPVSRTQPARRVVIEFLGKDAPFLLDFDYQTAELPLRNYVREIERFFWPDDKAIESLTSVSPPFFSDANAVLHWRFLIQPEACDKLYPDSIYIVVYRDGRIRIEGTSRLRPPPATLADVPVVWDTKQPGETATIVSRLLNGMAKYAHIPRQSFVDEAKIYGAHVTQGWSERLGKALYVRTPDNVVLDLSSGYDDLMRARTVLPQELRDMMFQLARYAQRQLPPPDEEMLKNCQESPGLK